MDTIGRFDILGRLGQGAFGIVYKGRDPILNRLVAIKVVTDNVAEDRAQLPRFKREAEAAGGLNHRNIVTIYELGEHDGRPFIAMEYLEGQDLATILSKRIPLTLETRLDVIIQVAEGLHYAHSRGIVHRDIKPGNIRLLQDGTAKIMDFGIARTSGSNMTNTGMVLGTVNYMAPEMLQRKTIDHRTDQFSLGVTAYELLVRRRPFAGDNISAVLFAIVHDEPQPLEELRDSPFPTVSGIVLRSLEKDPARRWPSCQAFAQALRQQLPARSGALVLDSPDDSSEPTQYLFGTGLHTRKPANVEDPEAFSIPTSAPTMGSVSDAIASASTVAGRPPALRDPGPASTATARSVPAAATAATAPAAITPAGTGTAPRSSARSLWLGGGGIALLAAAALAGYALRRPATPTGATASAGTSPSTVEGGIPPMSPAAGQRPPVLPTPGDPATAAAAGTGTVASPTPVAAVPTTPIATATPATATPLLAVAAAATPAATPRAAVSATPVPGTSVATDIERLLRGAPLDTALLARKSAELRRLSPGHPLLARVARVESALASAETSLQAAAPEAALAAVRELDADLPAAAAVRQRAEDLVRRRARAEGELAGARVALAAGRHDEAARVARGAAQSWPALAAEAARVVEAAERPVATPTPAAPAGTPAPIASVAPKPVPDDRSAIEKLLAQYSAALKREDLKALRQIWPSLGGAKQKTISDSFDFVREHDVELAIADLRIDGETATVVCNRHDRIQTNDGQSVQNETRATFELRRAGGGWVIADLR